MPTVGYSQIHVTTYGDVGIEQVSQSAGNINCTGQIDIIPIMPGMNTITPPSAPGYVVAGLFIRPPVTNSYGFTLKASPTDVGFKMHPFHATYLAIDPTTPNAYYIESSAPTPVTLVFIWI